jgi:hypothetical protein
MPYDVDHEVAVELEYIGTTKTGRKITVIATSLEHEISKVIVWSAKGRDADPIDTAKNPTNDTVPFQDTHNTKINKAHQVKVPEDIKNEDFPICIDVYEASTEDGEAADVHRHGWFDKTAKPVPAKDHPINIPKEKWKIPFYPTIAEEKAPDTGDLKGPEPYKSK